MKSVIRIILLMSFVFSCVIFFFSCGGTEAPLGKYESASLYGTKTVYEFESDAVSRTIVGELGSKTVVGNYEIVSSEDGKLSIILDFGEDGENRASWDFFIGQDYIEIAGIRYDRVN